MAFSFAALATVTGIVALIRPDMLLPFNRLWMRFGLLLGRVVNPMVMAVLFFALITPVAVVARLFGRDELRLRKQARQSYWRPRQPVGPEASSFKRQF